jgi:hypothetical protein
MITHLMCTCEHASQDPHDAVDFAAMLKWFNPKEIKANAAEIIKAGAALYDALGQVTYEQHSHEHVMFCYRAVAVLLDLVCDACYGFNCTLGTGGRAS